MFHLGSIGRSSHLEQQPQSHPQLHFPLRLSLTSDRMASATAPAITAMTISEPADTSHSSSDLSGRLMKKNGSFITRK